jgi:hypothetical protein
MSGEAVFVAAYALVLLGLAGGLYRLGRVNTDAWTSRVLMAYRAQAPEPPPAARAADWPHADARHLHTAIAAVAAAASALLCVGELVRHHRAAELLVLTAIAAGAGSLLTWLLRKLLRAPSHEDTAQ